MARIRTIKPEFFTSEDIVSISPLARLFYIGCWCEADREGRLEFKPGTLKLRYLPTDQVEIVNIVDELTSRKLLIPYQVEGEQYAYIPKFLKHQAINMREAQSKLPPINDTLHEVTCNYMELPVITTGKGREGKGREGKGTFTTPLQDESCIIEFNKVKERLLAEVWQETTCMNLGFEPIAFRRFSENWIKKKEATGDYMYAVNKLKSYLIADFEKDKKQFKPFEQKPKNIPAI